MKPDLERNKKIAIDFLLDTNSGDKIRKAYALSRLSVDSTWWVPGDWSLGGEFTRAQIETRLMGDILSTFVEPLDVSIKGVTAEGDRVAVEAEINGFKTSGEPYRNFYHFLFVLCNEQIVQTKAYVDTLTSYKALFGTKGLAAGAFAIPSSS
jgi:ketosteroid isomerase-like protein